MTKSKLELDKSFQLPKDANALSSHFDAHNGDFDTPEEFVRAYLKNDQRAINALGLQNIDMLREAVEKMSPEVRRLMREETHTYAELQECLNKLAQKNKPTHHG